jgi:hypothetical protein
MRLPLLQRILDWLKVNPGHRTSMLPVGQFRHPAPASQPEYQAPVTSASNISKNSYYQRETRRKYPATLALQPLEMQKEDMKMIIDNASRHSRHVYKSARDQPPASPDAHFPIHNVQ